MPINIIYLTVYVPSVKMTVVYIISRELAAVPSIRKTSQNRRKKFKLKSHYHRVSMDYEYLIEKKEKNCPSLLRCDLPAVVSIATTDDIIMILLYYNVVHDGTANRTMTTDRHWETRVCRTAQRDRLACGRHTA